MLVIKGILHILALLPLWLLHALAVPLALVLRFMPWRGHVIVRTNLALCFPELDEKKRARLYRRHLTEMARLVLESGAVWFWPAERLKRHVRSVEGWDELERAAAEKHGVLLVGAHFGSWEILPLWLSLQGSFTALYKAPRNPDHDRHLTASRERFGATLVPSGSPAMRRLLAGLRRGEMIGLLADQQPKQGEGAFVSFFEQPALTMTLVGRLARRTGCQVFFASAERLPRGRGWALRFEPAPEAIADPADEKSAAVMHHWLEGVIARRPEQYLWSYKRFSRQPDGKPSPYPQRRRRKA